MELRIVEAIDDGKIVKVPEEYAIREGLMILRKKVISSAQPVAEKPLDRRPSGLDAFRKPLKYKQNDVAGSLVEHFHWIVVQRRKEMGMTRKQVASAVQCSEHAVKMIENGILPAENYIIVNRIEKLFGIVLRKDGQNYQANMKELALNTGSTMSGTEQTKQTQTISSLSPKKEIAPAKRYEKPQPGPSRWMERRQRREVYEKERTNANALIEDKMTGSDIELFD
jgi:ribosome-binding protein aMBF1 (putative translation factor)